MLVGNTTLYAGQWYHLAHTRTGSINRLFVNGILQTSTYTDATSRPYGSNSAFVGQNSNCFVTNLRFVKGTSLYTQTFNPPAAPLNVYSTNTSVLLNTNFWDPYKDPSNNIVVTSTGTTASSSLTPFNNRSWSGYFSSSDGLSYTDTANFGTSDFTVEFWLWATGSTCNLIVSTSGVNNWMIVTYLGQFYWQENGGNLGGVGYGTVPNNQWVHLAASRTGGFLNLYINGTRVLNVANTFNYSASSPDRKIGPYTGGNPDFYLSNMRFIKGRGIYSGTSITPPTAPLTASTDTTLLTFQSSAFKDNSLNSNTFTLTGAPTVTSSNPFASNVSTLGTSPTYGVYFDGGSYLSIPMNALTFGTSNFTIEAWVYCLTSSAGTLFAGQANLSSAAGSSIVCYLNSGSTSDIYIGAGGVGATSPKPQANTWAHVAYVRNGVNWTTYLNGVQVGTSAGASGGVNAGFAVYPGTIGGWGNNSNYFNGYISNFRIVIGTALYTGAFTPPAGVLPAVANTVLLTLQDKTIKDNSTNGYTITTTGSPSPSTFTPFSGSSSIVQRITSSTIQVSGGIDDVFLANNSVRFNGTSDYFSVAHNTALNLASGDFTIEAWVYWTGANVGATIVDKDGVNSVTLSSYNLSLPSSRLTLSVGSGNGVGYIQQVSVPSDFPINQWVHVAGVKYGTTLTIYQNGVAGASVTQSGTIVDGGKPLLVGYQTNQALSTLWSGHISNLRIVKGTAVYTSNFTPPAAPLLPVNTSTFLLNVQTGTNRISDASIYNNSLSRVGTPSVSTTGPFPKVAHRLNKTGIVQVSNYFNELPPTGSISFNGTSDYLSIASSTNFSVGTGNYTFEAWIYPIASSGSIFETAGGIQIGYQSTTQIGIAQRGVAWRVFTSVAPSLNAWSHVAIVRFGTGANQTAVFVNGVATFGTDASNYGSTAGTASVANGSVLFSGGGFFNGYVTNLRVVNGTALYTGNFLVPTAPLSLPAVGYTSLLLSTPYIPPTTSTSAFVDYSINPNIITKNGSPTSIATNPFKL